MAINYINSSKKISSRDATMYFGYSSDHVAYLIRNGKINGKKIYTKEAWKVSKKELLNYLKEKNKIDSRGGLFSLFKTAKYFFKKYLSLKEASVISGYDPDYIGYLIRQGKLRGKKFYSGASWVTTRDAVKSYLDNKQPRKNKKTMSFSFPFWKEEKYFSFKISRLSFILALIVVFCVSWIVLADSNQNQNQVVNIYPAQIQNTSENVSTWKNAEKIKGPADADPDGSLEYFSEQNSAIYSGGIGSLFLSFFNETEFDLDADSFSGKLKGAVGSSDSTSSNGVEDSGVNSGNGTATEETSTEEVISNQENSNGQNAEVQAGQNTNQETNPSGENNISSGEEAGQASSSASSTVEGAQTEIKENSGDQNQGQPQVQVQPENQEQQTPIQETGASAGQTSFFDKIKGLFGKSTVKADELLNFKEISQKGFVSAKIKISLASGIKNSDIIPVDQQTSAASGQGFWEKIKGVFGFLKKQLPQVAKAQRDSGSPIENTVIENSTGTTTETAANGGQKIKQLGQGEQGQPNNNEQNGDSASFATASETTTINLPAEPTEGSQTLEETVVSNPDDKIVIWYSLDGQRWEKLHTISQDYFSNDSNGGYFSFDAPFLNSWKDIENLQIKIEGATGGNIISLIYLDSFWVEAEYQEGNTLKGFELRPLKSDWKVDEEPTFELVKQEPEIALGQQLLASIRSVLGIGDGNTNEDQPQIEADISSPKQYENSGKENLEPEKIVGEPIKEKKEEKRLVKIPKESFNGPGQYTFSMIVGDSGKSYNFDLDFSWGVLAINMNKSIYLPGDKAFLQMGVLDDKGNTICDADLTMEIIAPDGAKTILSTQSTSFKENYPEAATTTDATTSSVIAKTSGMASIASSSEEGTVTTSETNGNSQVSEEEQTTTIETTTTEMEKATTSSVITSSEEGNQTTTEQTITEQAATEQTITEQATGQEEQTQGLVPEEPSANVIDKLSNIFKLSEARAEENGTSSSAETEQEIINKGVIENNPECGPSSVTNTPDYFAYYDINSTGTYQIKLTAVSKNGTHEITDSFESRDWVPFDVERMAPTRIYPPAVYQTTIKIKANQDFSGQIKENIPLGFEIDNIEYSVNNELSFSSPLISNSADAQVIEWPADFKKDDLIELNYQFRAPNISPYSYLLGHLEFYDSSSADPSQIYFSELRSWQIAADAVISFVGVADYDSASTTTALCAKPTNTTTSDIMFALVMRGATTTNPNSVPTGWTLLGSNSTTHLWKLYYKMASSTEASGYTWEWAKAGKTAITIATYRGGFNTTNPISATSTTAYKTSDTNVIATTTAALLNSPLLFFGSVYATAARTFTKPSVPTSNWVENSDNGSTTSCLWRETASMTWASSGATGTTSATVSGAAIIVKQAFAVALNPSNVDVSGTIFTDEGSTTSTVGSVINLAVNGVFTASTTASTINGSYTLSTGTTTMAAGTVFTVYTSNDSEEANTITRSGTASITGLNLYKNHIIVRHEDAGPITIADLDKYDSDQNAYMLYVASSTAGTLTASSTNSEFFVWTGKTFSVGAISGAISLTDVDINGTFTATSTQTISVSGSWDATGGTFTSASSTVNFTATSSKTITTNGSSFYNLTFNGSGGVWNMNDAATTTNNLTMTAGTASSTSNMNVLGGTVSGNGTLNWTAGTFLVDGTGNFGGTTAWSFYNLTLGMEAERLLSLPPALAPSLCLTICL